MKRKSKIILALVLMLVFSTVVFAARRVNITVTYDNIKVVVDGNQVQFGKDTKGKQIEPFIYNGTTYLPLRAVGEALGKEVQWDKNTKTAYLGKTQVEAVERYLVDTLRPYDSGDAYTGVMGEAKNGIEGWPCSNKRYIMYYLNKKYTRLTGLPSLEDSLNETKSINVRFIGDKNILAEYTVKQGEINDPIDVDLTGVNVLKIEWDYDKGVFSRLKLNELIIK